MKKVMIGILALCFASVLVFAAAAAFASTVASSSDVVLDWSSLSTTGSIVWNDSSKMSTVSGIVGYQAGPNISQTESANDWTTSMPVALTFDISGEAIANAGQLMARSAANLPPPWGYLMADFTASRYGEFTATGTVTFTIEGYINQTMSFAGGLPDFADIYAKANLDITNPTTGAKDSSFFDNEILRYVTGSDVSGVLPFTLTVAMDFGQGGVGSLLASAESITYATVPEPSSMLLLGLGIAGMFGVRGRKFFNA